MAVIDENYPVGRNPDLPHDAKPSGPLVPPIKSPYAALDPEALEEEDRVNRDMYGFPSLEIRQMTEAEQAMFRMQKKQAESLVAAMNGTDEEFKRALAVQEAHNREQAEKERHAAEKALSFAERYGVQSHPIRNTFNSKPGTMTGRLTSREPNTLMLSPRDRMRNIFSEGAELFFAKNEEYGNSIELTGLVGAIAAMTGDVGAARHLVYGSLDRDAAPEWKGKVRNKLIDAMVQAAIAIMMLDMDNVIGR